MTDVSVAARRIFADLLAARTGQTLSEGRIWRLDTALRPLLGQPGRETLDQFALQLAKRDDPALADQAVEALLNQETSFLRDPAMFDSLVQALGSIPGKPRIWSAGCATGQEPLSLAMLLVGRGVTPEIVATDVSEAALARARLGRFDHFQIQRGLPIARLVRYFVQEGDAWVARPELLRHIAFRRHNLVADPAPAGRFDAVLCRNVLLYFDPPTRRQVLELIAGALRPGGYLALGAGETVLDLSDAFRPSGSRGLYELAYPARAAA